MTFRVGQKVVCVDDQFAAHHVVRGTALPQAGAVYTVREVFIYSAWTALRLCEIKNRDGVYLNDDTGCMVEAAFPARKFKPAVSPKQEVSFTIGADPDSFVWDNRRGEEKVRHKEPMPVDGWRIGV